MLASDCLDALVENAWARKSVEARKSRRLTANLIAPPCPVPSFRSLDLVPGRENCNGYDGASAVANTIRVYNHVSYHLSILHDRVGSLAHSSGSPVPCDRLPGLSRDL